MDEGRATRLQGLMSSLAAGRPLSLVSPLGVFRGAEFSLCVGPMEPVVVPGTSSSSRF